MGFVCSIVIIDFFFFVFDLLPRRDGEMATKTHKDHDLHNTPNVGPKITAAGINKKISPTVAKALVPVSSTRI